mgnify:CR=1 FL=1|jgi:hypothetical protein
MYGISPRLRGDLGKLTIKKTSISSRQSPNNNLRMKNMLHITEENEIDEDTTGDLNSHFLILDIKNNVNKPILEVNTKSKKKDERVV